MYVHDTGHSPGVPLGSKEWRQSDNGRVSDLFTYTTFVENITKDTKTVLTRSMLSTASVRSILNVVQNLGFTKCLVSERTTQTMIT